MGKVYESEDTSAMEEWRMNRLSGKVDWHAKNMGRNPQGGAKMAEHFPINFDKLYGGMTTEYFAFFCPKCHREIKDLFIDENKTMAVYNAKVKCGPCGVTYGFKLVKAIGNLSK